MVVIVPPLFLWWRFLCFLGAAFIVPVLGAAAAGAALAAGFFAFLFCAANADVPARAKVKTAVIRIRFIIVLREKFLAADSIGISLILLSSGQVEMILCNACARNSNVIASD